ncbi:MAG: PqqD family protein [Thermoplasmatota archaeon]
MSRGEARDVADHVAEPLVEAEVGDDGHLRLRRRKFGRFGTLVLRVLRISPDLVVKLDDLGAAAWQLMDGKRTVAQVADCLRADRPEEEQIEQRLGSFLGILVSQRLVALRDPLGNV